MVHHASEQEQRQGGWLPGNRLARTLIVSAFVLCVILLSLPLWVNGGFASAQVNPPSAEPGETVRTELFDMAVESAEILPGDDIGGPELQLTIQLTSHETEPVSARTFTDMLDPVVEPEGIETESFRAAIMERRPDEASTWVQPGTSETYLAAWYLPEELRSFGDATSEQVRVPITVPEYAAGFTDQTERWSPALDEEIAAEVLLPLGEG